MTREFKAVERFQLKRGPVVMVALDREEERDGLCQRLQAEGVRIDGVDVTVLGVDSWALATLSKGTQVGLLLQEQLCPGNADTCLCDPHVEARHDAALSKLSGRARKAARGKLLGSDFAVADKK